MKKIILFIFYALILSNTLAQKPKQSESNEGFNSLAWVESNFAKGKVPPFSFVLGGKDSKSFLTEWIYAKEKSKGTDPSLENFVYTYKDPQTGFNVKCFVTCFKNFPAVEWVLKFSNASTQNSPTIEKQKAVDFSFSADTGAFYLHYNKGCNTEKSDFEQTWANLDTQKSIYMSPIGGRSSDNTAFPFFNIEMPGKQGVIVGLGWTGKWYADVKLKDERTASLAAGMERMKLLLYPGEEIRSPRICLLFWKGENRMVGHNQFRRFILAHHTRKTNGKNAAPPFAFAVGSGGPPPCAEFSCATEDYMVVLIKRHQRFEMVPDVFWLDAGWYKGCGLWGMYVGNWSPNKNNFPNGLKPVSDAAHHVGAKFLVWFEPERVYRNTDIDREHPEFLLKRTDIKDSNDPVTHNSLFNLGNKEAREWMTDLISNIIKKEGIDFYRQDMNIDPMKIWEANDIPDRIGMMEIRHIEGLYAYWDTLLTRFPNLVIDNCAGGGRRIDLETISRSFPLLRSDYTEANGNQCHSYGLNFYLPIHGTANFNSATYDFRSCLGSSLAMSMDINASNNLLKENIKQYKRLQPYFQEDYYPLTDYYNEPITSDKVWLAYQFNRPEQKDGIILAFRRPECSIESITVKLGGLEAKANYELYFEDLTIKMIKSGAELMSGLQFGVPIKPYSLLISYKKI